MNLTVSLATVTEEPLLRRLLQLYLHDLSEYEDNDLNEQGEYYYPWVADLAYIVRVNGKPAGFVLVSRFTMYTVSDWMVMEFFIARKYRRQGIGRSVAHIVFDRQPGRWELQVLGRNRPAQHFWRRVLDDFTHGAFQEAETLNAHMETDMVVMWFDNREEAES
jgi:predicted acetyltransferase